MRLVDQIRSVRHTFDSNRGRVALTLLGIMIGAGSIVLLASLLSGGQEALLNADQGAADTDIVQVDSDEAPAKQAQKTRRELGRYDSEVLDDSPTLPGVQVTTEKTRWWTKALYHKKTKRVSLVGAHNASNAAAAAAVARALDVGEGSILDGLANVRPAKHRGQLLQVGDRTVLDDCYNAAPPSTKAALDALVEVTPAGKRRIAVLGDMLELGPDSPDLHCEVGAYAAARVDYLVTVGPLSLRTHEAAQVLGARRLHTDEPGAAAARVHEVSGAGDVILVKASRGMRLERVIEALQQLVGEAHERA